MSELKHSALPWLASENLDKNGWIIDAGKYCICNVYEILDTCGRNSRRDEANAAFICRAVNFHYKLLSACEAALNWCGLDGDGISDPARQHILSVLAEVEGRKYQGEKGANHDDQGDF